MKRLAVFAAILLAVTLPLGADAPKPPKGIFASLTVGQKLSLKDVGQAFTVTIYESEAAQVHTIKEVGEDFIVVDTAGVSEITIPIYAIKAIVKMKVGRK